MLSRRCLVGDSCVYVGHFVLPLEWRWRLEFAWLALSLLAAGTRRREGQDDTRARFGQRDRARRRGRCAEVVVASIAIGWQCAHWLAG